MGATFAYFYLMADDPARVRRVAPRHTEHWHVLDLHDYRGGPFADRSGGLITFVVDGAGQAESAVAEDPFVREGLVTRYWLREWTPTARVA
jgi:uncharacterized protein YciI